MTETTVIPVTGTDPYDVIIGRGLLASLADQLGPRVAKVLIVHPPTLGAKANALRESLVDRYEVLRAEVPDAEDAKRVEVAAFCWQPHTVRGVIAGSLKRKLGLKVTSEKVEARGRVYRLRA